MVESDRKNMEGEGQKKRIESEPPAVTAEWGWKYHHMGIPTTVKRYGEKYIPDLKMFVSGFESSPYGIEWMRFEEGSGVAPIVQKTPHIAFEVDDLEKALKGKDLIGGISSPSSGVRVAMILFDGAPVELMEFGRPASGGRNKEGSADKEV